MSSPARSHGRSRIDSPSANPKDRSRSRSVHRRSISPRSGSPASRRSNRSRSARSDDDRDRRNGLGGGRDSRSRSRSRGRSVTRSRSRSRGGDARRGGYRRRSDSRSVSRSPAPQRSSKIVVEKLTKNVNESHLREIFGAYGDIDSIDLPMNQYMSNRGTAYILYYDRVHAEAAIAHMHEAQLDGAVLNVSIVLPQATLVDKVEVTVVEALLLMVADILPQDDSDPLHPGAQGDMVAEEVWTDMIFIDLVVRLLALDPRAAVRDPTHRGHDHLRHEDGVGVALVVDPAHRVVGEGARVTAAIAVIATGVGVEAGLEAAAEAGAVMGGDVATAQASYCYAHDGVEIQNSEYYDGDALSSCREGPSTCCLPGESCGEDLLCHSSDGLITRQYCTDPTWPSKFCSALCPEFNAAGVELTKCEEDVYCCGPDNKECCKKGEGIRIDKKGQIIAVGTSTVPVTSTTATSTTSSSTSSTKTEESTPTHPIGVPSDEESAGYTPNGTDTGEEESGLSAGAGAGIGVGCAVALGIIGGLIWFLLRERKKRRALESEMRSPGPMGYSTQDRKGDGYYQPSMQEAPQARSSHSTQVHEAHSEPAVAELYGQDHYNQRA
ncbi:hypothetical protein FQN54_002445 [Arachnomyces sp. PD_36]|nr:hypothetical protein FQN54_002445 [Arachnomyces sp. PD_36]